VWPVVTARLAGASLQSFGFGGQCHLDQYVARSIRDLEADAISLKLGINVINADSMRERAFLPAVQGFLDTVRDGHPSTPIAIVTPIICPVAEDHPGPTLGRVGAPVEVVPRAAELGIGALTLRRIRSLLADVVDARRRAGDRHLHLLDGLELFGPDDVGDLPDGLHPNDAGYVRMGERFHRMAFTGDGPFAE
jgi:lysophospholipase L1-like esterase